MRFPFSLQRIFLILYSTERVFFYFLNVQVKSKAQFSLPSSWNSSMPYSRRDSFHKLLLESGVVNNINFRNNWMVWSLSHLLESPYSGRERVISFQKQVWRFTFETDSSLKLTSRKIKCIWNNMHFLFVLKHGVYVSNIIM